MFLGGGVDFCALGCLYICEVFVLGGNAEYFVGQRFNIHRYYAWTLFWPITDKRHRSSKHLCSLTGAGQVPGPEQLPSLQATALPRTVLPPATCTMPPPTLPSFPSPRHRRSFILNLTRSSSQQQAQQLQLETANHLLG